MNRGLPKLAGGIAKREREAWQRLCKMCGGETVALVESIFGPNPACEIHAAGAERLGYRVIRREPLS